MFFELKTIIILTYNFYLQLDFEFSVVFPFLGETCRIRRVVIIPKMRANEEVVEEVAATVKLRKIIPEKVFQDLDPDQNQGQDLDQCLDQDQGLD